MSVAVRKEDYLKEMKDHDTEVRNLVMDGYEQVKQGNTKDFNSVCERLEKKYSDAVLHGLKYTKSITRTIKYIILLIRIT